MKKYAWKHFTVYHRGQSGIEYIEQQLVVFVNEHYGAMAGLFVSGFQYIGKSVTGILTILGGVYISSLSDRNFSIFFFNVPAWVKRCLVVTSQIKCPLLSFVA